MKNSLGNPCSCGTSHQRAAIMKGRLKRIQYRPALIDGFLAQTGLSIEPEPPQTQTLAFQAVADPLLLA